MLVFFLALLQLVVSAKAGMVNSVYGQASVAAGEQLRAGIAVRTGDRSHVEIALTPSALLRLDQNSAVVLDSVDLDHVVVHLASGALLIAAKDVDSSLPIHVISGNLHVLAPAKGLYRFSADAAIIVDGKLSAADSDRTFHKGTNITIADGRYIESPVSKDADSGVKKFLGEPKAGFINAVDGQANVKLHEQVREGQSIRTGPGGRVEIVAGPNEYLRLDENSVVVFDSIKLLRQVYRIAASRNPAADDSVQAVLVNERLRPAFRISGTALLERTGRVSRFIDNTEFSLARRPGPGVKETWQPVRAGIQTTSRGTTNLITMEPDSLDRWSEQRSYEFARATQMAYYSDMPHENGWIFSPQLNGLTYIPVNPTAGGYGYFSTPLFPTTTPNRGRGRGLARGGGGRGGDRGGDARGGEGANRGTRQ